MADAGARFTRSAPAQATAPVATPPPPSRQVHLVDDDPEVLKSLALLLRSAGYRVVAHSEARQLLAALDHDPEAGCAVVDLRMPGMAGLDGIGRFRTSQPDVPVLLMSGLARQHEVRGALAAGARGFVDKSSSPQVLINTVEKILAGQLVTPAQNEAGSTQHCARDRPAEFTRREHDVLSQLVQGRANKVIARHLNLQEVTVKLHLRSIFRKLKVHSRTQAVLAAVSLDLIHADTAQVQEIRR